MILKLSELEIKLVLFFFFTHLKMTPEPHSSFFFFFKYILKSLVGSTYSTNHRINFLF